MNGKGSDRRPRSPLITEEEFKNNWDNTFKKNKDLEEYKLPEKCKDCEDECDYCIKNGEYNG
jgi:hypothetical protein